jgi:hypothetical protein
MDPEWLRADSPRSVSPPQVDTRAQKLVGVVRRAGMLADEHAGARAVHNAAKGYRALWRSSSRTAARFWECALIVRSRSATFSV